MNPLQLYAIFENQRPGHRANGYTLLKKTTQGGEALAITLAADVTENEAFVFKITRPTKFNRKTKNSYETFTR